jgi:glycosyltransferase involved in cell wall biosynthesis
MTKILLFGDSGQPSGYGRIADEIATRLHKRGYHILAASIQFDGLLPPHYEGAPLLPYYWVASLGGRADWLERFVGIASVYQPDIIMAAQDMPYLEAIYHAPLDWSKYAFIGITPVDGAPVLPAWADVLKKADAALVISQFGVDAYQKAGVDAKLCRPGVDGNVFFRMRDDERLAMRAKAGIPADAFVLGTFAQNQGRKSISLMLKGFFEFAQGKANVRYLLDMTETSPAGWNIPALCEQYGWDTSKLIFREQVVRAGLVQLRERYNLLDVHAVISHREGYGLPLTEGQACGAVAMAQDYCSGREICGDGKGVLVKTIDYAEPSTWGGSEDRFVDLGDFVKQLQRLYDDPNYRNMIAKAGMEAARAYTWDQAADAVHTAIETALAKRAARVTPQATPETAVQLVQTAASPHSPDGVVQREVALVEG